MDRREFIVKSSLIATGLSVSGFKGQSNTPLIRFGVVTDLHYAEVDPSGNSTRYYRHSIDKLNQAIELFNAEKVDFIVELGDLKDQDKEPVKENTLRYLGNIENTFAKFNGPRYHVLGNHDMDSLSKKEFLSNIENTGIPKKKSYYSYDQKGFHFVVLDANFTAEDEDYDNGNFDWTDCNINPKQLKWLQRDLEKTEKPTVVFVHQQLDTPLARDSKHCVVNADEVRAILENSGKVAAVFQGHDHVGGYSCIKDIHYFTQVSLVDGKYPDNNSYSIVEILENGDIRIKGYANCESRIMHKK